MSVATVLVAIGLGGAVAHAAPGTTTPGGSPAPFAFVPASPQSNVSAYPVLARLGRWDGTTFQPVAAGSIAGGHVVFISHGWSPGYVDSYQQLQQKSPTLVTAWTPGLVNSSNQSMMDTWVPVAQALQGADPTATIVLFSWVDQSATGNNPLQVRDPEQATEVNGHRFATAIDQSLAPGFSAAGGQVHLIGHSFGANVATTAALSIAVRPRQLTLLDSPEVSVTELAGAKNDLRYKLPRLDIGRGPGQTFVDNYISYVGVQYATYPGLEQVVDVRTAPPPSDKPGDKHSFAIEWYRTSAQNMGAGVGYAWSPLLGANVAALGAYYQQPDPANVLALNEVNGTPPTGVATQMLVSTAALEVPGVGVLRGGAQGTAPRGNGVALGGGSPATWNLTFATDETSLWLDVDVALEGVPGDVVSFFVDGRQRFLAAVPDEGTGAAGLFVILYDVTPGDHVLSIVVSNASSNAPAGTSSVASVSRLRMSSTANIQRNFTPAETNALIIVALVGVGLVFALLVALAVFVIRRLRRAVKDHRDEGNQPP